MRPATLLLSLLLPASAQAAPVVTALTLPAGPVSEGTAATLGVTWSSASLDAPTISWDFGDGSLGSGEGPSHTWADDGTWTITVEVCDADLACDSGSASLIVQNRVPTLLGSPATVAREGQGWSFSPTGEDPGSDTLTWSAGALPATATLDGTTGALDWLPRWQDAGPNTFQLSLSDGDGGVTSLGWTVTVRILDEDGDRMSDLWEASVGLDPGRDDGSEDPDLDGRDNEAEFLGRTDPTTDDRPGAPRLLAPEDGTYVSLLPDLVVGSPPNPLDDTRWLRVELYGDEALTDLLFVADEVPEDPSGETTWSLSGPLSEDQDYYWRAALSDAWAEGEWSGTGRFTLSTRNDPPALPSPVAPEDGAIVTEAPTLVVREALDPEGGAVTTSFQVFDEAGAAVDLILGLPRGESGEVRWVPTLPGPGAYQWRAQGVDASGAVGPWTTLRSFELEAPSEPDDSGGDGGPTLDTAERDTGRPESADAGVDHRAGTNNNRATCAALGPAPRGGAALLALCLALRVRSRRRGRGGGWFGGR